MRKQNFPLCGNIRPWLAVFGLLVLTRCHWSAPDSVTEASSEGGGGDEGSLEGGASGAIGFDDPELAGDGDDDGEPDLGLGGTGDESTDSGGQGGGVAGELEPVEPEPLEPEPLVIRVERVTEEPFQYPPRCESSAACESGELCRQGWCAPPTCGNGKREGEEECDDGNEIQTDGCELNCTSTTVLKMDGTAATCALFSPGTVKCWGEDEFGRLGRGTNGLHLVNPAEVEALDFGTTRRVIQLTAGSDQFCVLFEDNRARCWGHNDEGALGINSFDDYGDDPEELLANLPDYSFSQIRQISIGRGHACILRGGEVGAPEVRCWGNGNAGQLGNGTADTILDASAASPVVLPGITPREVSALMSSTCLLFDPGKVICWGNNSGNGLSGFGNTYAPNLATDALLSLGTSVDFLVSGSYRPQCTFDAPNELQCWGINQEGSIGTPYLFDERIRTPVPIRLGKREFVDVQIGSVHGCGLTTTGQVLCFGQGKYTGYAGSYDPTLDPEVNWDHLPHGGAVDLGDYDGVEGIDPVARIFVMHGTSCAEMQDRSLRCWGSNNSGRLGYGFETGGEPPGLEGLETIGDNETPAEAYKLIGRPDISLW